jgi:hypothetical protein
MSIEMEVLDDAIAAVQEANDNNKGAVQEILGQEDQMDLLDILPKYTLGMAMLGTLQEVKDKIVERIKEECDVDA